MGNNKQVRRVVATFIALLAVIGIATSLSACGGAPGKQQATSNQQTVQQNKKSNQEDTKTITDSCGREITIPTKVDRIVASGPVAQQMLLTIAPEKMVGLARKLTPEQKSYIAGLSSDIPEFGQIYGGKGDFNKEAVAAADPQLIIDIGEAKETIVDDLKNLQEQTGIPCIHVDTTDIKSYADAYDMLGDILGEEKGHQLAEYCRNSYNSVMQVVDTIPADKRVRAAYLLGDTGTSAMAKGGYQAGVIDLVSNNVIEVNKATSNGKGNDVSLEQLSVWNPDLIVFSPESIYDSVDSDESWSHIAAIKNHSYYKVPGMPYNWLSGPPSVNQILGLQWYARLCYPDKFTGDFKETVKQYYQLFYGHNLSDEEYATLTQGALPEGR